VFNISEGGDKSSKRMRTLIICIIIIIIAIVGIWAIVDHNLTLNVAGHEFNTPMGYSVNNSLSNNSTDNISINAVQIENGTDYYRFTVISHEENKIVSPSDAVISINNSENVTIKNHKGVIINKNKKDQSFMYKDGSDEIVIRTSNPNENAFADVIKN
jgi:hypothetical protein